MAAGELRSMQRLGRLDSAEFEIAFMKSMSRHHWKAVGSAETCVERAYHQELLSMCQEIVDVQVAEIRQLQTWLCEWYDRCGGRPVTTA